ncbi:thioesterase II family protein [Burkholderia thailandensis]|uniref:thioesterase II family protein n=1 Tax=Burkholderia thailandensis TaxID=57975 RepID=UPI000517B3B1|nr:alpha/beta fold hydrolase [Burkholderia thailandensis]AIT20193.1 thioesterase domain protein [Burkholderia thailandensis E254]AVR10736.1 thioesterase [Burkholderia thailandensis]KIS56928.1 thioesterase domain protein [Burkholderia thailandensis Phuket 4W-1]MBS2126746.1 thioesterase [Burkholderia thailandensis]MCS3395570.1 alpha/beta fold hydrolase [Burkholderia thailandensis]
MTFESTEKAGAGRWIEPSPSAVNAVQRLFCIPYAGGGASVFRGWPARLGATVDVRPLHPPGRGRRFRDALLYRVDRIADEVTEAIAPLLDRPYTLFGHSMGASVAFEVASRIQARRLREPTCLIVSGRGAPHLPTQRRPIHDLPDDQFLDEVIRMNGTPPEILAHPEVITLLLPILRADFKAVETYRAEPHPPLNCRIVALGGSGEPDSAEAVESWRTYTTGGFRGEILPGDHFFIHGHAERLFSVLGEELTDALRCAATPLATPVHQPSADSCDAPK